MSLQMVLVCQRSTKKKAPDNGENGRANGRGAVKMSPDADSVRGGQHPVQNARRHDA
jgi:hypothetical protein